MVLTLVIVPVFTVTATQTDELQVEKYERIPNTPNFPTIDGPTSGDLGFSYEYEVSYEDPEGNDVYFKINWGDGWIQNWDGPHKSGEVVKFSHCWSPITFPTGGNFNVVVQAQDVHGFFSKQTKTVVYMDGKNGMSVNPLLTHIIDLITNFFSIIKEVLNL